MAKKVFSNKDKEKKRRREGFQNSLQNKVKLKVRERRIAGRYL
jgi:hypothetical protein